VSRLALTPVNHPALGSAPTLPTLRAGDIYYDTSLGVLVYTGTAWTQTTSVALDCGTSTTTSVGWAIDLGASV
jgi:hypothetical protein